MTAEPGVTSGLADRVAAEADRLRSDPARARLEDELASSFEPLVPCSADAEGAGLEGVERAAFIDVDVPLQTSRLRWVGVVKQLLRPLLSWYLAYVAGRVTLFATRAHGVLADHERRIESLEQSIDDSRDQGSMPSPARVVGSDIALDEHASARIQEILGEQSGATLWTGDVPGSMFRDPPTALRQIRSQALRAVVVVDLTGWADVTRAAVTAAAARASLVDGGRLLVVAASSRLETSTWDQLIAEAGFATQRAERLVSGGTLLAGRA